MQSSIASRVFVCHDVPVNRLAKNPADDIRIGRFTGTVTASADMEQVTSINGVASFEDPADADRVILADLCVDLRADKKEIYALYTEEK